VEGADCSLAITSRRLSNFAKVTQLDLKVARSVTVIRQELELQAACPINQQGATNLALVPLLRPVRSAMESATLSTRQDEFPAQASPLTV